VGQTTEASAPNLSAIKERQRVAWTSGDYAVVGATLQIIPELLCESTDLRAGRRVLDVATGSGNAALAAARRMCEVTGIDYVPALLERARRRAESEGLDVAFSDGDAEAIPFANGSFDVALSVLGVMFAPDQARAAAEIARVCRSGGVIGLASWTPESFIGTYFAAAAVHVPPPAGLPSPFRWGDPDRVRELLADTVESIHARTRTFAFRHRSAREFVEWMSRWYGPTVTAFGSLDHEGRQALQSDLVAVAEEYNRADDGSLVAPAEYLEVVAVKA
jgi:SAM-dependent methyltransferase